MTHRRTAVGCVYICRNTIDGKVYIGKTVKDLATRRSWHQATALRGEGWRFHRALRKHGLAAFEWGVLFEGNDPGELDRKECEYIAEYKSNGPDGYNLTRGGDGATGRAPEVMERIAAFHRGRKRSPETKKRISDAAAGKRNRLGAVLTMETKRKIAASLAGHDLPEGVKAKIGEAFRGKPKSPEQRAKMSEARKRWWERRRQAVKNLRAVESDRPAEAEAGLFGDLLDGEPIAAVVGEDDRP
jgi:group I intron endonuclease